MAIKLTKAQEKKRDEFANTLSGAKGDIEAAIQEFNDKMEHAWQDVAATIAFYNEVLNDAREFRDDLVSNWQSEMYDKSDRWREGERGEEAQSFVNEWENASLDEIEIEQPGELDVPDMDHDETLGSLPDAPG